MLVSSYLNIQSSHFERAQSSTTIFPFEFYTLLWSNDTHLSWFSGKAGNQQVVDNGSKQRYIPYNIFAFDMYFERGDSLI